jgi:hypothetical protein
MMNFALVLSFKSNIYLSHLTHFGVTTFHFHRRPQRGTEPALYSAIVIVDYADDRVDCFGLAVNKKKRKNIDEV